MFDWLKRKPEVPTREVLGQAVTDIGSPQLAERALHLYEFPNECEEFLREHGSESPECSADQLPKPELASMIFTTLLIEANRIGVIDWADGPEQISDCYDSLLSTVKANTLTQEERDLLVVKTEDCKRGESFLVLREILEKMVSERGLMVTCLDIGGDAHFPLVIRPEIFRRWENALFGKNHPVLP